MARTTGVSVEARYAAIETRFGFFLPSGINATYSIDGNHLGTTVRSPPSRGLSFYNRSLFSIEGLSNTEHTLRVELLRPTAMLV